MEVNRYVNGVKTEPDDFKKIVISNPVILRILANIDKRIMESSNNPVPEPDDSVDKKEIK